MVAIRAKSRPLAVFSFILILMSGCGGALNGEQKPDRREAEAEKPKEPYTMKIYAAGVAETEFDDRFRQVLKQKFPHITVEYFPGVKGATLPNLVAEGNIPDLIRTDVPTLRTAYLDLSLGYDLNDFVKKYKYDLSRFTSVFIDEIVDAGRTGALYGLPVPPYFPQALYYNKDLFDKFGVPYPKKTGITWDEVYDLAKKLTRVEGGAVYRGFSSHPGNTLRDNQFSLPILDPSADQLAEPEKWKVLFNNLLRFYEIPNNTIESTATLDGSAFAKGNVAMMTNQHSVYLKLPPELNWDLAAYPTLEGAPKLMPQRGPAYWSISNTSTHKEDAFEMIMVMLADEVQMADSRKGITTTLNSPVIKSALGKESPVYSTKNMDAVNVYPPIPYTKKRKAGLTDVPGLTLQNLQSQTFVDVAMGKMDVNTALRQLDEKLKAELAKEKSK
ncbi:ABC transporter substrate-binding protein [Paenibacillus ginsengarvi]|uniref:Extracellular solute-binding protein n=1 Tax=Paenibacillus ginsengarvi TaxID=400777 RepID=A0A3B0CMH7_9BACL|nr:extracellular solute-binding protein [Paenibacillus ginsengarvi]RKN86160.1 extracellular solute-binding protein [Paenibacillus ginsengarvi]